MSLFAIDTEQLIVRDMQISDLVNVVAIEQTAQPSPWSRLSFEESLIKQHVCRVLHEQKSDLSEEHIPPLILAFHVVCPVADELHILNLVVGKQYQGHGFGHRLMHDILDIAGREPGINKIFLEVRESNQIAQNLYQQWQFQQIAVRKDYYRTPDKERENAVVMLKKLEN